MRVDISLPADLVNELKYRFPDHKTFSGLIQGLLRTYCQHGDLNEIKQEVKRIPEIDQRLSVLESQIR